MLARLLAIVLVTGCAAAPARPVDRARALAYEQAITRDERTAVSCAARAIESARWRTVDRGTRGWWFVVTHPDRPGWRLVVEVARDRSRAGVRDELASGIRRRRRRCSRTARASHRSSSG